jgi:arsenate reductase (glutaredoxin)
MSEPDIRIYHNPRCSKSRAACALIEEKGCTAEVIEYLKAPPSKEELRQLLKMLDMKPGDLVRKNEEIFRDQYTGLKLSDEQWLDALVAHPILIERPIVVRGSKAVVARPAAKVMELL